MTLFGLFLLCVIAVLAVTLPVLVSKKKQKNKKRDKGDISRIFFVAVLVPILSVGVWVYVGGYNESPPTTIALDEQPIEELLRRVENVLVDNPDDSEGWRLLARGYGSLGRLDDRERALRHLIRIEGATAEHLSDLGELMVIRAGNVVTTESKEVFGEAVGLDSNLIKPRFYLGVALRQEGNEAESRRVLEGLLSEVSRDDPWHGLLTLQLGGELGGSLSGSLSGSLDNSLDDSNESSGPTAADISAAEQMTPEDRQAMIESMVSGLASRLEDNPDDIEGWSRLIRSYVVLEDEQSALDALNRARIHFVGREDTLEQLGRIAATYNLLWEEQ